MDMTCPYLISPIISGYRQSGVPYFLSEGARVVAKAKFNFFLYPSSQIPSLDDYVHHQYLVCC